MDKQDNKTIIDNKRGAVSSVKKNKRMSVCRYVN